MTTDSNGNSKRETDEPTFPGNHLDLKYNAKKPRWWTQQRGHHRRGSKRQRRIMEEMKHFIIPPPKYGETLDWNDIFTSHQYTDIWIELGFGLGENLLRNAQMYPEKAIVGAEVHPPGSANVLKSIQKGQQEGTYRDDYLLYSTETNDSAQGNTVAASETSIITGDGIYANVRVFRGNGMKLVNSIPASSVSAILITFPDPFPKEGHEEFRLLQVLTATDFYRALRAEGRLYLATDHEEHFEWCLNVLLQCQDLFISVTPVPDRSTWLPVVSKYEQKGLDEGRCTHLACWQVIGKEE